MRAPALRLVGIALALIVLPGLAAAAAHATIYVPSEGRLWTAGLDGSNPQYTDALPIAGGIASDGMQLFYATGSGDSGWAIGEADTDASSPDNTFVTIPAPACGSPNGLSEISAVALSQSALYWADSGEGTIGRAALDGSGATDQLITASGGECGSGGQGPVGLGVSGTGVFWSNPNQNTIGHAALDGSSPNASLITGASYPTGVAVQGEDLYWLNAKAGSDGSATIGHAKLDTGGGVVPGSVNENFIGPIPGSYGNAVGLTIADNELIFDAGDGWIGSANLDGSGVNLRLAQLGSGAPVAADGNVADPTTQSVACTPANLELLDPGPAPDVSVAPPVLDTTHCTVTVRDAGPNPHRVSGTITMSQAPVVGDLFASCSLKPTAFGQAACATTLRTDDTAQGYRRSDAVSLTSHFPGNVTQLPSTGTTPVTLQRVRPCGLTRDAEIHFYAWLCPGSSTTPLVQHEASARLPTGTLIVTTPYWCDAALTPVSASASFYASAQPAARLRRVVFAIAGRAAKTARHAPFRATFSTSTQAARSKTMHLTARATLSRGSQRTATARLTIPHC